MKILTWASQKINFYLYRVLCLCMILVLFSGCNVVELFKPEPTPVPRPQWLTKFLENPTCQPPCWENITPGVTRMEEVIPILSQVSEITNLKRQNEEIAERDFITWVYTRGIGSGSIECSQEGIVKLIHLTLPSNHPLAIEEIVSKYGDISHVRIGPCVSEFFAESCEADIIFINSGMSASFSFNTIVGSWKKIEITPDLEVRRINLFVPGEEGYLESFPDQWYPPKIEWQGYGRYDNPEED